MRTFTWFIALVLLGWSTTVSSAEPKVETVIDGLYNPCGITFQPKTGHLFVADSGAGQVLRIVDGKVEEVITGFPKDVYGKGPMFDIGPLGLVFLSRNFLVVGGGGLPDGEELLRLYKVPAAGKGPIKADKMQASFKLPPTATIKGEGNFYDLALTKDAIYITSNGDDTKGWVAKAERKGNKIGPYKRFLATKEAVQVDAPVGITISPKGELVVGQMGEINIPKDSLLSFYDPKDGKLLRNYKTSLFDIASVRYSPKSKKLYAIDFAWMATKQGALYRLDVGKKAVKAVKIMSLDKPSAMAFGPDGALYITVFGTAKEGDSKKPGKVIKVTGFE